MTDERRTPSGLRVDVTYGPEAPGVFPFTRGIHPDMYRGRLWTMRQYAGFGTAHETNQRFRHLLDAGQTGLSVAFDLPTQMGYDSDAPAAEGEVGRAGVAIDSVDDLALLFDGIPLDRVSTSMTINATAPILLAMYVVIGEERAIPRTALRGTVQNDILKEYAARGTYIYPPEPSLRLITDVFAFVAEERIPFNPISVSGYHIREAGATAIQEVAFTLADGIEYLDRARAAGLDAAAVASRVSFFFAAHNDLFEEVAKFRAAREVWASIVKERYGGDDRACKLRFHTQTGGSTLTAHQPVNNVVRVAVQALAAVLGGTQSLHTNSFDEALSLPTADAARLALRTQQIIANESGVALTADPLGGSYYVEHLTETIVREVRALLDEIGRKGGAAAAIERGDFQEAIARSAYEQQRAQERGDQVVVGVNRFAEDEPAPPAPPQMPDYGALAAEQVERVRATRAARDAETCHATLDALAQAARTPGRNLMPLLVNAVRARATVGEISDTLREVWGTHRSVA